MKNILLILFVSVSFAQPKYFDPDGYYFPSKSTKIAGYQLELFNVHTLDYYNNGELNYDNPKFIKPEIIVSFLRTSKRFQAKDILISRDTISFKVDLPNKKVLALNGIFLDHRGQFWNQSDIKSQETPILSCIVFIYNNGKLTETKKIMFTYWEGD
jgi:hypothetical protein